MGNIASLPQPLLAEFRKSGWVSDLKAVKKLIKRFERVQTEFGWAINYDTFKALYKPTPPPAAAAIPTPPPLTDTELESVWKSVWDAGNKGKADVLQIFAGSILCCKATYDE